MTLTKLANEAQFPNRAVSRGVVPNFKFDRQKGSLAIASAPLSPLVGQSRPTIPSGVSWADLPGSSGKGAGNPTVEPGPVRGMVYQKPWALSPTPVP